MVESPSTIQLLHLPTAHVTVLDQAQAFATLAHLGQRRASGEPYIEHPAAVARILAGLTSDSATIASGWLHDVVEDTPVTLRQIRVQFGPEIAFLVRAVTKTDIPGTTHGQSEVYGGMPSGTCALGFYSPAFDRRVALIRLSDRLHNMRTLSALPIASQVRIAQETLAFHVPLAHSCGVSHMGLDLQKLAFFHLGLSS